MHLTKTTLMNIVTASDEGGRNENIDAWRYLPTMGKLVLLKNKSSKSTQILFDYSSGEINQRILLC